MILLSARDLTRQFDTDPVFSGLGMEIRRGDHAGLVGPNGSGKTTLLNILAGLDDPDTGVVESPKAIRIALLEQQPEIVPGRTLWEEAALGLDWLYALQREAESLAARMSEQEDARSILKRYDTVHAILQQHGAFQLDHRVAEVLEGLGFAPDEFSRDLSTFSGGEQARASLSRLLLSEPDLMLLDEPTNHLDITATEWLENHLSRARPALLVVSHDRFFLDKVVNRVFELRPDRLDSYPGNFSAYRRQRAERQQRLQKQAHRQQEFISETKDFIRRNQYGQKHKQAADRVRKLERVEEIDQLDDFSVPPMTFGEPGRSGDLVLEAVEIAKGFDKPLFSDLTLRIERGQRLGILGPNGSGKTTLLKALIGELEIDKGSVRFGTGVELAYFDQGLAGISARSDLVEAVRPPGNPDITPGHLRSLLARFGLRGDIVLQAFGNCSGGERSKTALAKLAALNANLLVLDEPTNHLDIWACDGLEAALNEFPGTVLFVTHDRYFIDQVATQVLVIEPQCCRLFDGNYSKFLSFRENNVSPKNRPIAPTDRPKPTTAAAKSDESAPDRKRVFPYRKVVDLEQDIAEAEARKSRLEEELSDPTVHRDGDRLQQVSRDYDVVQDELVMLLAHWEEAIELN
ncbi:MAG: ABC transporter [Planctomycetaceae bacterium]|jgi:ATP-binding cassette subfamily F protein 3|nr:ABC transporter [Planctomycetaceae bacterium]MDP7274831.1 ABC-F family ATP-binding cassette domain-containing protein [Planctomycetaceae bacterium]